MCPSNSQREGVSSPDDSFRPCIDTIPSPVGSFVCVSDHRITEHHQYVRRSTFDKIVATEVAIVIINYTTMVVAAIVVGLIIWKWWF